MKKTLQQDTLDRWLSDHSGIFYKLVRVYAFNHHDREDLFQEIVLQVWNAIPNFNHRSKESTYVYQVALFAAMAWERMETRHSGRIEPTADIGERMILQPGPANDPRLDWIYMQISKMKVVDRSLMLLLLEGYSYHEIASLLGLTESNVGSRLTRLKTKITNTKYQETRI